MLYFYRQGPLHWSNIPLLFLLPCLSSHRLALSTFSRMNTNSSDEFFQATNHAEQTFRKMETYLQHKQLCDVLLIAGEHKIPAHRLVFVLLSALISLITPASTLVRRCWSSSGFTSFSRRCARSGFGLDLSLDTETYFVSLIHLRNYWIICEMQKTILLLFRWQLTGKICKLHVHCFASKQCALLWSHYPSALPHFHITFETWKNTVIRNMEMSIFRCLALSLMAELNRSHDSPWKLCAHLSTGRFC